MRRRRGGDESIFSKTETAERLLNEQRDMDESRRAALLEEYRASIPESHREVFNNVRPSVESFTIASAIIIQDETLSGEQRSALHMALIEHWHAKASAEYHQREI